MSTGSSPPSDDFQRAFVAVNYLLGLRSNLVAPSLTPCASAAALARQLEHPDRTHRAQALAPELGRLVRALDARRVA